MPELELPPKMATLRTELGGLVSDLEARAPYGAVLLSARRGLRIEMDDQVERVIEEPPTAGTVITVFDGRTVYEQAVSGFDPQAAHRGVVDLLDHATYVEGNDMDPGPQRHGDFVTPMQIPPAGLSLQEKLERCRELHRQLRGQDPRIVNVRVIYSEESELSAFGNRRADLAQRVQRVYLLLLVFVAGPDGAPRYDYIHKSATAGWEALHFSHEELQAVVDNALALRGAERIEPGEYTVITAPGVTGTLAHESFGHGVETDMFLKERARAAQYMGKAVGSPLVNIWDDPSTPGQFGSYFFDDEGWLAAPTQIVEGGVFRRGITDLYSATTLKIPRSANGRRQDFSRKAYARMSNTFFAPGTTPVADLFAQVEDGVYLEKWSSGMEDPQGWGIQVTCHYGREIKKGQLTGRLFAPVGISGYVPHVLQGIRGVGDVWQLDGGTCGKGHKEYLLTSSGGPHLLLKARLA